MGSHTLANMFFWGGRVGECSHCDVWIQTWVTVNYSSTKQKCLHLVYYIHKSEGFSLSFQFCWIFFINFHNVNIFFMHIHLQSTASPAQKKKTCSRNWSLTNIVRSAEYENFILQKQNKSYIYSFVWCFIFLFA